MIYLIRGDDHFLIQKKIKQLIEVQKDAEIINFKDNDISSIFNNFIEACTSISLFSNKKIILFKDPLFLIEKCSGTEENLLSSFFKSNKIDADIIFYEDEAGFDMRLKISKLLIKNAKLFTFNRLDQQQFNDYCLNEFNNNGIKITRDAALYLALRCNRDSGVLVNLLAKMKLYGNKIDYNNVKYFANITVEEEAIRIIDAIGNKNVKETFKIFNYYNKISDSYLPLIASIYTSFCFYVDVAILRNNNYNDKAIADMLKCNPNRLYYASKILNKKTLKDLFAIIYDLSKLDISLKSNANISQKIRIETFLLKHTL